MTNTYTDTAKQLIINDITDVDTSSITFNTNELYLAPDNAVYSVNNVTPVNGNVTITVPTKISDLTDDTSTTAVSNATTASKLGSSDVGSVTTPIYLDDGEAKACTYSLAKSVPSDAVFTDTTYTFSTGLTNSSGTITVTDYAKLLKNTATSSDSLTINGTNHTNQKAINIGESSKILASSCVAIGYNSTAGYGNTQGCVSIGYGAYTGGLNSIALGGSAMATNGSIQIGAGTNSNASTLSIGFGSSHNYQLLDGTTGLIPDARISSNIARSSAIPTDVSDLTNTSLADISLSNVSSIDSNSAVQTALDGKASSNLAKFANVRLLGSSLELSDFVVSGFSQLSYIQLPLPFSPITTWTMQFKFSYTVNSSDNQIIVDATDGFKAVRPITIFVSAATGKIIYGLSSDATNWDIANNVAGSTTLVNRATYYLKAEFTGSAYNFYLSTDGKNWTTDYTVSSSTHIASGYNLIMGLHKPNCSAAFIGSFDLKGCYIDVDNYRWWNGIETATNGDTMRMGCINAGTLSPQEIFAYGINSTTYKTITLPASGGTFTAPYDGTIIFQHRIATAGQLISLGNSTRVYVSRNHSTANNMLLDVWLPCRKGDVISIEYTGSSTTTSNNFLRCYRAIGGR